MGAQTYKGSVLSFRNDRMDARLLALLNAIRIAQDYDLPYYVCWKTDGRTSEELQNPTEILDAAYFAEHSIPLKDYTAVSRTFLDLLTLPPDATAEVIKSAHKSGKVMHCHASSLVTLPWEDAADVAPRYAAAIDALHFSPEVTAAMAYVDKKLQGKGTVFHIRRADIIHDPITSNQLWSSKFVLREFYKVLAKRLLVDPDNKKRRRALKQAAETGGKNSLYQGAVALMFWDVGRKGKAIKMMQNLCDAPFVLPEVLFLTAKMICQHKDTSAEALAYMDRALTLAPHVRRYMTLRSNMLISLKQTEKALASIDMIMARFGATDDLAKLRKRAEC